MQASVYTVWQQFARFVKQVVPALHGHRCKTLAWLVIGIMVTGSVASARVAEVLRRVSGTQASSQERTFSRFLANRAIDPHALWRQFLPHLLADFAQQREITFVVDLTPIGTWAISVWFGILHHSRVWPLGWRVMPGQSAWEQGQYAIIASFVEQVRPYVAQAQCRLLTDSGIAREKLVQLCERYHWHYRLADRTGQRLLRHRVRSARTIHLAAPPDHLECERRNTGKGTSGCGKRMSVRSG